MKGELKIARTIEEFSGFIGQGMAEAEERNLLEHTEALRLHATGEDAPPMPRVATLGFVPTMGALHEGHGTLIRRAREQNDLLAVSIFVNPLQFGPDEDLERYPRTPEQDIAYLKELGADILFMPEPETMYPLGKPLVSVTSGELGRRFEGASRPGHFDGVLTVVNKLLNIVTSSAGAHRTRAYFGQKDVQQVVLVQRMVADFGLPVAIVPVAIVREDDGLALSSRNAYLSPEERNAALVLSRTLALLREEGLSRGFSGIDLQSARDRINNRGGVELDYLELVDPQTFGEPTEDSERVLALAAVRIGETRLIDNMDVL